MVAAFLGADLKVCDAQAFECGEADRRLCAGPVGCRAYVSDLLGGFGELFCWSR